MTDITDISRHCEKYTNIAQHEQLPDLEIYFFNLKPEDFKDQKTEGLLYLFHGNLVKISYM